MKNTNITRTVNFAHVTLTVVNMETLKVETMDLSIPTTQKLTEKEVSKTMDASENYKVLKVSEITYTSKLYEMDLDTFVKNAREIGTGRTTL